MTVSSPAARSDPQELEVKLLVDMVRLSRVTLLIAEPGSDKSRLIQSSVMPLLNDARAGGKAKVAVLFDAWDKAPLAALHARIHDAVSTVAASGASAGPAPQSLVGSLRAWQEALGVTFLIIFDRFEEYLQMPIGRVGIAEFEEELVQAIKDPTLRANFLLSLDEHAEPLLGRLREHIPRLGYSRVRLPRASHSISRAQGDESGRKTDQTPPVSRRIAPIEAAMNLSGTASLKKSFSGTESHAHVVTHAAVTADHAAAAAQTHEPVEDAERSVVPPSLPEPEPAVDTPPPSKRQLTRLAWVPIALSVVAVFLFFQAKPQQPGEHAAQRVAPNSTPTPARTQSAAEPQQNLSAPVQAPKNEPAAAAERVPAAPAIPSAARVPATAASSAQPGDSADVTTAKPAPSVSAAATGAAQAVQPARQAELSPSKAPPTASRNAVAAAQSVQPARQPEPAAKPAPAARQPSRQPEVSAVQPAPAPSQPPRRPEVVAKAVAVAPTQSPLVATPSGPTLYIHVRNEAQRAWAEQMIRPLGERGIRVAAIKVMTSGPDEPDLRYYDLSERDEVLKVAIALRDLGLRAQQLKHIDDVGTQGIRRQYELWLPSTGYDQRP